MSKSINLLRKLISGALFFSSLSWAADTISIEGTTYKVSSEVDIMAWFKKGKSDEIDTVYTTGIEGIYCNKPLYQNLNEGCSGSDTSSEMLLFDSLKKRVIATGMLAVAYGRTQLPSVVQDSPSNETNSVHFKSVDQFVKWIDARIKSN